MSVTLYTTHCPRCGVIEEKMKQKNINYELIDSTEEVVKFGRSHKINTAPILDVDGEVMDFSAANKWINEYTGD